MTTGINIVTRGDSQSPIIILNRCFRYINQMLYIYIHFHMKFVFQCLNNNLDFQKYINNFFSINIILSCNIYQEVCIEFKSYHSFAIPLLLSRSDEDALRSAPGAALPQNEFWWHFSSKYNIYRITFLKYWYKCTTSLESYAQLQTN